MTKRKTNINININILNNKRFWILLIVGLLLIVGIPVWIYKFPIGFNPPSIFLAIPFFGYIALMFYLRRFTIKDDFNNKVKNVPKLAIFIILLIIILYFISTPLFTNKKQKSITSYEQVEVKEVFKKETEKFILVDSDYAKKLGDKILGSEQLGNFYKVGEYQDIMYKGKFVSVAPLEFNDFIISLNKKISPGYIVIDKCSGEVNLIDDKKINYTQEGYLLGNVKRKFALSGVYDNYGSRFEIDEEGNPFYISNNYTTK